MSELEVLAMVIADEMVYQHWRLDKSGADAFKQVLKWMTKIRCREAIEVAGRELLASSPPPHPAHAASP